MQPSTFLLILCSASSSAIQRKLRYISGDALQDPLANGPDGNSYPWEAASKIATKQRIPRTLYFGDTEGAGEPKLLSPAETRNLLLSSVEGHSRVEREAKDSGDVGEGCVPSRLCPSSYNTTAPLYGISLTSGKPVTIVQKFPDLLQQVVFQVCKSSTCEVIHGECVQTYLPYLFLVIPLGPVTLTGQDYVLVESGCVCRPKYARTHDEPPPLPFIQPIQN